MQEELKHIRPGTAIVQMDQIRMNQLVHHRSHNRDSRRCIDIAATDSGNYLTAALICNTCNTWIKQRSGFYLLAYLVLFPLILLILGLQLIPVRFLRVFFGFHFFSFANIDLWRDGFLLMECAFVIRVVPLL